MSSDTNQGAQTQADPGLPMSPKWDPEQLAQEKAALRELESKPLGSRSWGYIKRTGPGLLQSAMTLGAGSAATSVLAGASFGYKLLWVQPLAMFLGVMMLGALSNVVLTRGERPYESFGKQIGKPLVFLWALGTILASVIWHFPQYALLAGAGRDLAAMSGMQISNNGIVPDWIVTLKDFLGAIGFEVNDEITTLGYLVSFGVGAFFLAVNIFIVSNYGKGARGVKFYERFLRLMIALVIVFFFVVCVMNWKNINWTELGKGFCGYYGLPKNPETGAVDSATVLQVLGMLGAAVGINMTFLYPYSLLAKGWGEEHKKLARWDLGMTMFLPFSIVTSLIIVAMTVTGVYGSETLGLTKDVVATGLTPWGAADAFQGVPGGRVIFCLGLMGMCGGAISTHMVACGFTLCEMFGGKMTAKRFKWFALTPCIGFLGVVISLPMYFPVVASAVCLSMLPIAYLIFFLLNNSKKYIGDATGKGFGRLVFNVILLAALVFACVGSAISIKKNVVDKFKKPAAEPAQSEQFTLPAGAVQDEKAEPDGPPRRFRGGRRPPFERRAIGEPGAETPAVETPAGEESAVEAPAPEAPAVEEPAVETPASEAPAVEEPALEIPEAEQATPAPETAP